MSKCTFKNNKGETVNKAVPGCPRQKESLFVILYSPQRGTICQNFKMLANCSRPRVFLSIFCPFFFPLFIYLILGRLFGIPLLSLLNKPQEKEAIQIVFPFVTNKCQVHSMTLQKRCV